MAATDLGIRTDFEMHSGDDRTLEFTVNDENDAVLDVTGATFRFNISKLDTDVTALPAPKGAPILSPDKTIGVGITVVDAVNGRIDVALNPADTAALKGFHYFELEMIAGGETSTVAFGELDIHKDLLE